MEPAIQHQLKQEETRASSSHDIKGLAANPTIATYMNLETWPQKYHSLTTILPYNSSTIPILQFCHTNSPNYVSSKAALPRAVPLLQYNHAVQFFFHTHWSFKLTSAISWHHPCILHVVTQNNLATLLSHPQHDFIETFSFELLLSQCLLPSPLPTRFSTPPSRSPCPHPSSFQYCVRGVTRGALQS